MVLEQGGGSGTSFLTYGTLKNDSTIDQDQLKKYFSDYGITQADKHFIPDKYIVKKETSSGGNSSGGYELGDTKSGSYVWISNHYTYQDIKVHFSPAGFDVIVPKADSDTLVYGYTKTVSTGTTWTITVDKGFANFTSANSVNIISKTSTSCTFEMLTNQSVLNVTCGFSI